MQSFYVTRTGSLYYTPENRPAILLGNFVVRVKNGQFDGNIVMQGMQFVNHRDALAAANALQKRLG